MTLPRPSALSLTLLLTLGCGPGRCGPTPSATVDRADSAAVGDRDASATDGDDPSAAAAGEDTPAPPDGEEAGGGGDLRADIAFESALPALDEALAADAVPELGDPADLTDEEIDAFVAFLVPYVQEAAGAEFTRVPPGKLGTVDNLAGVLERETREIIARIYDVPDPVLDRMARQSAGAIPGLLGKYATSTGAVYVVPVALTRVARRHEALGDNAALIALLLVTAHELGHALQDQVADLDRVWGSLEDLDHLDGARGITEGQANWIERRVAIALGLEDAFWKMVEGQGWSRDGLDNPGAFSIWMRYGQGLAFCEYHAARGGSSRLWEMVKAPPRSTTMLFRPERYAPTLDHPVQLTGRLAGVEKMLTNTDWIVADTHLGEAPLREVAVALPDDRVDRSLDGIRWGHELQLQIPPGGRYRPRRASIQVVRFGTPEAATDLVDMLSDGLEAQAQARTRQEALRVEAMGTGQARTWTVEAVPYDKVQGDAVLRRVVGPTTPSGARLSSEEEQALWVVRGTQLVVVQVQGFRPGNRLDKTVEAIFERLDEGPAASGSAVEGSPE